MYTYSSNNVKIIFKLNLNKNITLELKRIFFTQNENYFICIHFFIILRNKKDVHKISHLFKCAYICIHTFYPLHNYIFSLFMCLDIHYFLFY